ncbi:acyl-CoA thioesterase [Candidatus Cetobacterium colombiensis]|uniref:Thioesterase family protein n=1 Tax=Candidatus Cetobacterium colombiensis TaxID=3073100 RepID=A0ABU4W7F1_9FUSO|nr:thioesterase family protein [Candidatus Cetobacterium colombiensis]MDX8335444.1 thioesterase family protein [Candidatus Cetobacterium colombiensis]
MFFINYKVTISDINYGGHMGNERALILFQQARIDLFKSLGVSEVNVGENVGTIQKDAHVNYKGEIFLGEELKVIVKQLNIKKTSLNFIYNVENSHGQIVLEGSTLIVAFDYKNKKIARFPLEFLKKLELDFK